MNKYQLATIIISTALLSGCAAISETQAPADPDEETSAVPNYVWEIQANAVDTEQVCKCTCSQAATEVRHLPLVANCRTYNGDACEIEGSRPSRLQGCRKTWVKK